MSDRDHLLYTWAMLTGDRDMIPFEVSAHIVPLKRGANGREDLDPEYSPDRDIPV
jgi:hypothetical protein